MISTAPSIENMTLEIKEQIAVHAPLDVTFAALLEQLGPSNQRHYGVPMPMKLEPWPVGRWYRDLGDDNGHFWGHVQAIKKPTLIEISGPLFASYPFVSNVQYRLTEANGTTTISFRHTALGFIQDDQRSGVSQNWKLMLERVRKDAEGK